MTVWRGVSQVGIAGPYFFDEGGAGATVDPERYNKMLSHHYLWLQIEDWEST